MRRTVPFLCLLFLAVAGAPGHAYRILYAEQYYRLYSLQLHQYPDDTMANIFYLEQAMKADFANPLNALARIENKQEWERYRLLFRMHVNLKLIELYLTLGSKYDKMVAYFYNAPWQRQNLESLDTAEQVYRVALAYWQEARRWSAQAFGLASIHLEEIQKWEDECYRIQTGDLDYEEIIQGHLSRLERVRQDFLAMDENTY